QFPIAHSLQTTSAPPFPPNRNQFQHLSGTDAAARGWPASTPHTNPWPKPTDWTIYQPSWIERRIHAYARPETTDGQSFSMEVTVLRPPLPILQNVCRWWPNTPEWSLEDNRCQQGQTGDRPVWWGTILNPIAVATPLWLLLVGP